jgi:hypothetical protein
MNFKSQEIKRITIKSPSIPLFQRGKLTSPPFGLWPGGPLARKGLWPGGKREAGRDFQSAKVLQNFINSIMNSVRKPFPGKESFILNFNNLSNSTNFI